MFTTAICLIILCVIGKAAYDGYRRGVLVAIAPFLSFILAFIFTKNGMFRAVSSFTATLFPATDSDAVIMLYQFLILYFITSIAVNIFTKKARRMTVISSLSSISGAIINGFLSIIRIWIVMMVIALLASFMQPFSLLQQQLFQSSIYSFIFFLNPLY